MNRQLISALSLSGLLLACAHDRSKENVAEADSVNARASAETREERAEDRVEDKKEHAENRADAREETAEQRAEHGGDIAQRAEGVDVPKRKQQRGEIASAGAELPSDQKQPDNTGVNERDRGGAGLTPMDQGNSEIDIDMDPTSPGIDRRRRPTREVVVRVGVISDTHGKLRAEALAALRDCATILHAGDVGRPEVLDGLRRLTPHVIAVRGNVDGEWASGLPERTEIELAGRRVLLLHDLARLEIEPRAAAEENVEEVAREFVSLLARAGLLSYAVAESNLDVR
jgi:putative phosphoesterase